MSEAADPIMLSALQHWSYCPLAVKLVIHDAAVPVSAKIGVVLAAVKEWRAAQGYGTPDGADFVATVAGGLVAVVLLS